MRALKQQWPAAELTFVGLPWARELCARLQCVDRFEEFPGFPGLPERAPDIAALPGFLQRMQDQHHDLSVQLHGSGNIVNQIVACFGARRSAGFHEPAGFAPDPVLYAPWPERGHEIERMLRVVDHLGIGRAGTHLEFPLLEADRRSLADRWPDWRAARSIVVVHAGAQLPSRRWMPDRFAAVADELASRGHTIVLTGTPGEADIVRQVRSAMRAEAVDLVGLTTLWSLGALVESAAMVVSNDTGIMHVAAALGTPSVAVSSGADVSRWAPLDASLHRVLWHDTSCRPCSFNTCPYGHECARGVEVDAVIDTAMQLLARHEGRTAARTASVVRSSSHTLSHEGSPACPDLCASSRGMSTATISTT
jgi:ADP-heptose:LPS heptosyltransferase